MRTAVKRVGRQQVSTVVSVPAPIGGINAADPLTGMPPQDAVTMSNWWVTPYDAQIRQGWAQWGTGTSAAVTSLCAYNTLSGTNKLFACDASKIYDVTTAGAASSVQTGLTSGYWQHQNFGNAGGNWLIMVNGLDKPRLYDGATWEAVDGASTHAITGVTTTNLVHVTQHKNRLMFVEKSTLKFWYLAVNAIGGAASSFPMQGIFKRGGYIMAMTTWTIDAGLGMDDHLVIVSNRGEVAVYKGTDISDSTKWSLAGLWQLGEPLGRRCFIQFGGDVAYISKDGVQLLSTALASSRVNTRKNLSNNIQTLISDDTSTYGSNLNWQMLLVPQENMLIVNVPLSATRSRQWAMNTISQAWTRFDDVDSLCWEIFNDTAYFGHASGVGHFWQGWTDNMGPDGSGGNNINYSALQSFQTFDGVRNKRFTAVRPLMQSTGQPSLFMNVNVDYDPSLPTTTPSFGNLPDQPTWNNVNWNAFKWAGSRYLLAEWQYAGAVGYSAGTYIRGASRGLELRWASTDLVYERGGII